MIIALPCARSQARTLAERQLMQDGEMEARQIDVLWLLTISVPLKNFQSRDVVAKAAAQVLDSFTVQVDDAL